MSSDTNICVHITSLTNIIIILTVSGPPSSEAIISLNLVCNILYSFTALVSIST